MPRYDSLYHRLVAHTAEPENGQACWVHDGPLSRPEVGYPKISVRGRAGGHMQFAHRLMFEIFHGPIPQGHEVDHRCHNHRCINIDHLQLLPIAANRAKNRSPCIDSGISTW